MAMFPAQPPNSGVAWPAGSFVDANGAVYNSSGIRIGTANPMMNGVYPPQPPTMGDPYWSNLDRLSARFGSNRSELYNKFKRVELYRGDVMHLWVITKSGQPAILEDDLTLFPSDGLTAQLRLLMQD